jgi:asparagine synthase (glutamine-hydrolysing)
LTARYGATAISTGDGGDSLFGASAARFSVSDYWKRRGPRPALLRLASDVALLRNQTVWGVLARTLRQEILGRRDRQELSQMREARQLVRREIREPLLADRSAPDHPWFRSGRVPLSVREVLSFLTTPDLFYDPISSPDDASVESVFPLLSQPLVELCMSIPSYVHFDQGRDRGLARRAFANDVPAPLLDRTWKDRVQGFPEQILRSNLAYFKSMLMDGILVKKRYLDRQSIERTLSGKVLKDTASVGEIVDHVLVEAWLRSWSGRCTSLA